MRGEGGKLLIMLKYEPFPSSCQKKPKEGGGDNRGKRWRKEVIKYRQEKKTLYRINKSRQKKEGKREKAYKLDSSILVGTSQRRGRSEFQLQKEKRGDVWGWAETATEGGGGGWSLSIQTFFKWWRKRKKKENELANRGRTPRCGRLATEPRKKKKERGELLLDTEKRGGSKGGLSGQGLGWCSNGTP